MVGYLVELGYFKRVKFLFLIAGHTKNACDRLFNVLKALYRLSNIYTYSELIKKLNHSQYVTIHEAKEEDFFDWGSFLKEYYRDLVSEVKVNHLFEASHETDGDNNKFVMELRESALAQHKAKAFNLLPIKYRGATNRAQQIRSAESAKLRRIKAPGINIYKLVELWKEFRALIPFEFRDDPYYARPHQAILDAVTDEKKSRKDFNERLKDKKLEARRKGKKA